jgi:hypothetical protein
MSNAKPHHAKLVMCKHFYQKRCVTKNYMCVQTVELS